MENTTEITNLQIVRMKDDCENGCWGAAIKQSLMPSQFYIIEKKPETISSLYYSLVEPSTVFTLTKSAPIFLLELLLLRVEPLDEELSKKKRRERAQMGGFNVDDLCMQINVLENRPMWIDDSEIQSVTELCEKCRRLKEERHIQFAVIDDFLNLPIPDSVNRVWKHPTRLTDSYASLPRNLTL